MLCRTENILLTDKNDVTSVVLTDFGISRCGDLPDMKLDGFGTPAYMAPELFGDTACYTEAVSLPVLCADVVDVCVYTSVDCGRPRLCGCRVGS